MKTIKNILFSLLLLSNITILAQGDIHYSQFYTSPTYINPATTGAYSGDVRFFTNYRTQWGRLTPNKYRTIMASFDAPIRTKGSSNKFGLGINFYNDKAGDGLLKTNNVNLNGSYIIEVGNKSFLSMGIGVGMHQRSIDFNELYWNNQWSGETFDASLSTGENGASDKFQVIDLSAGIYYYSEFNEDLGVFGGVSLGHFNRPNVTFLGKQDQLLMKITAHGGLEITVPNSKVHIVPNALIVFQAANNIINIGSDFKYLIKKKSKRLAYNDEISMSLGAYYRIGDAAYMAGRFNYAAWSFGLAYDYTLSNLAQYNNGVGGVEFFMSYVTTFGLSGGVSKFR